MCLAGFFPEKYCRAVSLLKIEFSFPLSQSSGQRAVAGALGSRHFRRVHRYTAESARKSAYFYDLAARRKSSHAVVERTVQHLNGKSTSCVECKKKFVNIHRHLKSAHNFAGSEYIKKLSECKSMDTQGESMFSCPVIGCTSVVKHKNICIAIFYKRILQMNMLES